MGTLSVWHRAVFERSLTQNWLLAYRSGGADTQAEMNELHPPPKPGTYKWVPHKPEPPKPRDEIEAALVEWNYEWEQGELEGWPSDEAESDWQARGRELAHRLQDRHPEWQVLYVAGGAWEFMKPPWDEAE